MPYLVRCGDAVLGYDVKPQCTHRTRALPLPPGQKRLYSRFYNKTHTICFQLLFSRPTVLHHASHAILLWPHAVGKWGIHRDPSVWLSVPLGGGHIVSPRDNLLGSVMQCYFEFLVQAADINGICYFYSNSVNFQQSSNRTYATNKNLTNGRTDYMQQTVALRFTL